MYNFDIREMLSSVKRVAKKASYVLIDVHDNFFSLLCITLLINQKRARLRNANKYPAFYDQARIAAQCTPWKQEAAYRFEYWNYFDKCKSR